MPSKLNYRRWLNSGLFILFIVALMIGLAPDAVAQAQSGTQLRTIQSDSNHVVLELQVSGYNTGAQTADGTAFSVITIPDFGSTGEPGKPALPIKGAMIGIPPGAQAALKVLDDQSQQDALARPPLPVPTQRVRFDPFRPESPSSTTSYARDAATYSANRLYPAEAAQIASTGNWRSQRYAVVEFHPLQYNPTSRQLVFHRRLRVEVTFTYPGGLKAGALGGPSNEGPFEAVLQKSLLNYDSAKNWRSTGQPALRAPSSGTAYAGGTWYRVGVASDGIYHLTCPQLPGSPGSINPNTLRLFKEGTEMAIIVSGNWMTSCTASDYIEFFGQSPDSFYSQNSPVPYNHPVRAKYAPENIYWLNIGAPGGKRMAVRSGAPQGTLQSTFVDTVHLEQNVGYGQIAPAVEDFDHWVWNAVSAARGTPSQDYTFDLPRLAGGTSSATLYVDLYGASLGTHHTVTSINGNILDNSIWPSSGTGMVERQASFAFSQSFLSSITNTITIGEPDLTYTVEPDLIYTNSFDVSYPATFKAITDTLRFRQPLSGPAQYSISDFSSQNVNVFEITDRFNVAVFNGTTMSGSGPYTLAFGDNPGAAAEYIALTTGAYKIPSITLKSPSNLQSTGNGADYILITYGGFKSNVQPLANLRTAQGLRVQVVDVQDIYDEFSDGLVDAHAIRAFLDYTYGNWVKPAPSYVLLVGDGTYDPRGYCNSGNCLFTTPPLNATYIPPYLRMVDPFLGEVASDNRLVSFNDVSVSGNTLPYMMIGRMPANSLAEVDTMVNRTIAYEQNPPTGTWGSRMTFVADAAYSPSGAQDPAGDFWAASDSVARNPAYVPGIFGPTRVYLNICPSCTYTPLNTPADVHNSILSAINSGTLFLSYVGHGATNSWSNSHFFGTADLGALTNTGKLTILVEMTCLTGHFADPRPANSSLAESLLRATSGSQAIGAAADWAATGFGVGPGHDLLEKGFFNGIMYQGARQMGTSTLMGKVNLWTNGAGANRDLIDTFILLGDPALHLTIPTWSNFYLPMITR